MTNGPRVVAPVSVVPRHRAIVTQIIGSLMAKLAERQVELPWVPLLFVFGLSAFLGWRATRLELRTRYDQLLPENQSSVIELRRIERRANGAQTAMIVLEGDDEKVLRRFGDAIVLKLSVNTVLA